MLIVRILAAEDAPCSASRVAANGPRDQLPFHGSGTVGGTQAKSNELTLKATGVSGSAESVFGASCPVTSLVIASSNRLAKASLRRLTTAIPVFPSGYERKNTFVSNPLVTAQVE